IPDVAKQDYYRLANCYVMPSAGEGFGFVILEALACGVPVVASNKDGTREAVRNGALGLLVDPDDSQVIIEAVMECLNRPRTVPSGLEYFSFENFTRRLDSVLTGLRMGALGQTQCNDAH